MKVANLSRYALNLGWFISILGGISLFERGIWSWVGMAIVLLGLGTLVYSVYTFLMDKKFEKVSASVIILLNAAATGVLMAAQFLLSYKTEIKWPLLCLLLLLALFMVYARNFTPKKGS